MTNHADREMRPTRARYTLLLLLCALTFVLYLDRICISQAVDSIQEELSLTNTQMSLVLMAFTLAYGLFEVPTGHWGDQVGARSVLTRIAVWWSLFTALTAASFGFWSLLLIRFLFGAGEAGAYPNVARIVARWYPLAERGKIQGLVQTAAFLGGTVAPVMAAYLIQSVGWRWAFVLFGMLGIVWAWGFWNWFRDDPAKHTGVNSLELLHIGTHGRNQERHRQPIPWSAVARNPSIWFLAIIMTCASFNSYFYFSWFPKYLKAGRDIPEIQAGWLASFVLGAAALGTFLGGFWVDRTRGVGSRRWHGGIAFFLAALFLGLAYSSERPWALAFFAALSCFFAMSTQSGWWSCSIEISGRHLGALFGLMNGMGVFGAMASQYFVGAFTDWRKERGYSGRDQWDAIFPVYMGVLLIASLCWALYQSRVVVPDPENSAEDHAG
ncbi:MAG: MFS transporter [Gemmataceae bacterium]